MTNDGFTPITIDKKPFRAPKPAMTGTELKALAGIDQAFRLFKEAHGKDPDIPIGDAEVIQLSPGDHFYSLPVGRVGDTLPSVKAEIDEILAAYPDARVHRNSGTEFWIEVPGVKLPPGKGWNQETMDILVPVPAGYPTARPPTFFVRPGLARGSGGVGGMGGATPV